MTMMAKHSSIATIKSRKNRGALLLLLAAATMLVMGAPVSAQETPDFEAIRSVDTDIAAIGYRLATANRSEEHTSELQSLMRISYAVFCLKKKNNKQTHPQYIAYHKQY